MLVAPAILVLMTLPAQAGRADQVKEQPRDWKPGPKVAQEISRLEGEGRAFFKAFRDGKLAQLTLIRELARVKTTMEALKTWSFANHCDEVARLAVVIDPDEYLQVFPRGIKHLPAELIAGEIYPATPASTRRWQYLGERRVTGMRLSIFRYAPSEVETASTSPN